MFGLCPKCWNKRYGTDLEESHFCVTYNEKICKECGKITKVVLTDETYDYESKIWYIRETELLVEAFYFFILIPFIIYKRIKHRILEQKE